jgi:hypothetical protein
VTERRTPFASSSPHRIGPSGKGTARVSARSGICDGSGCTEREFVTEVEVVKKRVLKKR